MPDAAAPRLGPQHPQRRTLAAEVHARPSESLSTPSRASFVAVMVEPEHRDGERAHLAALCARHGVAAPAAGSHFSAAVGPLRVKWERHGEFSGYTFIAAGTGTGTGIRAGAGGAAPVASHADIDPGSAPFADTAASLLPPDWLAGVPGTVLVAAHALLLAAPAGRSVDAGWLGACFGDSIVVGGGVGEGAGAAYTDFRVHDDGFSRFVLVDAAFTLRQAGRMLQRLFEIETYRMMALLALPVAQAQSAELVEIERALSAVTADIAGGRADDEALLHEVTRLAAEVESCLSAGRFRFGACRAYAELVATRIAELRESRQDGVQPIGEFMARRFTPAVATCAAVSQRLHELSERVARASALLSTRVDIARERQNQALLGSMDRRARAQLRLQQTVEGLSVAAIVYYAAGLVGYVAKGLKTAGAALSPDLVVAASIPVLAVLVLMATRRARRHLPHEDRIDALD